MKPQTTYAVIVQRVDGAICEANLRHPENHPIHELETAVKFADELAQDKSIVNVMVLEQRVVREFKGRGAPRENGRGMLREVE